MMSYRTETSRGEFPSVGGRGSEERRGLEGAEGLGSGGQGLVSEGMGQTFGQIIRESLTYQRL